MENVGDSWEDVFEKGEMISSPISLYSILNKEEKRENKIKD